NLALINTNADRYMKVGGGCPAAPGAAAGPLPDVTALVQAFASPEANGGGVQRIPSDDPLARVFGDRTYPGATAAWLATVRASMLTDLPGNSAATFAPGASGTNGLRREIPAGGSLDVLMGGDGDELQIGSQGKDVLVGGFGHPKDARDAG